MVIDVATIDADITNTTPMIIGKAPWYDIDENHFNGSIDEIRIWNDVRTESEIKGNMHKELAGNEANLVAYYKMSNGSGLALDDNQAAGTNDGTISGAEWKASGALAGPRQALNFDGVNDYVNCGNSASLQRNGAQPFTLEAWVKPTGGVWGAVISKFVHTATNEGYSLEIVTNNTVSLLYGNNFSDWSNTTSLGAKITTAANMGSTTITRGHTEQTGNGNVSILRYYDIAPTNNTALNASLGFNYHSDELNGLTEDNFRLYQSVDNGTTWTDQGGTLNTGANTVTKTGISSFSRWTVADYTLPINVPIPPVLAAIEGSALSYTEGSGEVPITNTITVSDEDDTNLESAVVQITGNYQSTEDYLAFVNQNGITGSWNSGLGKMTLTGSSSVANFQTASLPCQIWV